jgi:hypothetical protein
MADGAWRSAPHLLASGHHPSAVTKERGRADSAAPPRFLHGRSAPQLSWGYPHRLGQRRSKPMLCAITGRMGLKITLASDRFRYLLGIVGQSLGTM